jgi:uncharacterized membrane protein/thiol-disulfide isomerase/thioredoxin
LGLSVYLGWHYLMGGTVIGCDGGSSCDQVLSSRWSAIGGVLPVSGLAAGVYLAMLLASLNLGTNVEASVRRLAWHALLVLAGAAAGSAVWFIIVQKWYIGAFCPYCMATHLTSLLMAALVIWQAPRQSAEDAASGGTSDPAPTTKTETPARAAAGVAIATPVSDGHTAGAGRMIAPLPTAGFAFAGLLLAGLMAAAQVTLAPPSVSRAGDSPGYHLTTVDPHAVPVVGSPDAPYVLTLLFDYNCPHCQRVHEMLDEVIQRYDGKVAFALCPAPLNPRCNPYIPQEVAAFKNSCELARIAMAVWVAKHAAFADFDRWMYTPEPGHLWHPRSTEAAQAKAVELVGQAKFDAVKADPWIEQHLQTSVRIYGETGANAVPKLVFGTRWVSPEPTDADDLVRILHTTLGLPLP